jgi:hypothetical protein
MRLMAVVLAARPDESDVMFFSSRTTKFAKARATMANVTSIK